MSADVDPIIREIRALAMLETPAAPYLPLPCDPAEERLVLSAVLDGKWLPSELPATSADFAVGVHSWTFAYCEAMEETGRLRKGDRPDLRLIVQLFRRNGVDAEKVAEALLDIRDEEPFVLDIPERAARIAELARRRDAIGAMHRIDSAFRSGLEPVAEDVQRARELLARWEAV